MFKIMMKRGRHIELFATTDDEKKAKYLARQAKKEYDSSWVVDECQDWRTIYSV